MYITDSNDVIQYAFSFRNDLINRDLEIITKRDPARTKLVCLIGLSDISMECYKSNGQGFRKCSVGSTSPIGRVLNSVLKGLNDACNIYGLY